MKTYLECVPCFFRQLLEGARLAGASPRTQKKLLDAFARQVPSIPLHEPPPAIARHGYAILNRLCGRGDPYRGIKKKSNDLALRLRARLAKKVRRSRDPLLTAIELAIAGNVIDFGVKNNVNVRAELASILAREEACARRHGLFHYGEFRRALDRAQTVLYLADNAGEIVFDGILLEEMRRLYPDKSVIVSVKERPVINDALMADARAAGIPRFARVMTNGADAPGTILGWCSPAFRRAYREADLVISKGQGNFESLSDERRKNIFFLFMVKCPVVARETGRSIGDIVLLSGRRARGKRRA